MRSTKTTQTERSEAQLTEQELAERYGVEEKTVKLIRCIVEDSLNGLNQAVKGLTAEITPEEPESSETPAQAEVPDSQEQFLRDYIEEMTREQKVACFVLLDVADSPLGKWCVGNTARMILWESVKDYAQKSGWEKELCGHECIESVTNIHALLNFWRQRMEAAEQETEPAATDEQPAPPPAEQPKPTKPKGSMHRDIDDAKPAEQVIINWLLRQDYKTKLACVIMGTLFYGDHGTDGIANDINNQWTTEILDNAMNPADGLTEQEKVMTGVVVEMELWRENY
ncbi:MAG: hypothetical protein ACYTEK_06490 [Planctomycetota bacterium]|jgi:hypothetical protein